MVVELGRCRMKVVVQLGGRGVELKQSDHRVGGGRGIKWSCS